VNFREEPESEDSIHSRAAGSEARLFRTAIFCQQGLETSKHYVRKHLARDGEKSDRPVIAAFFTGAFTLV
jgi:hypothetical protein